MIVLTTLIVTFVPQHESNAVGVSNVQPVPHSSVRGPAQLMVGGLVSTKVMISLQNEEFEQQSVAFQVSVILALHGKLPLVTALKRVTRTVPQQLSNAGGGTGVHGFPPAVLPHMTTWLVHKITGGVVSTT